MTIKTINDLKPDPNNANRGTERGHRIVNNSIQRHGAGRSGLAARDGTMIAGSQTLEEMAALGMKIKPVHTTGDEWVVVIRDDVEPGSEQATLMGLEDNRGAQEGIEWDPGILAELAQQFDVSGLFTGDELAEWAQPSEPEAGAGGDEFDTTPDDGPTRAQIGDLWIIGGVHRLLVGDCTDAANVARLMGTDKADMVWTDPPYGVDYEGGRNPESNTPREKLAGDTSGALYSKSMAVTSVFCKDSAPWYVWFADRSGEPVYAAVTANGYKVRAMIVWNKLDAHYGNFMAQYMQKHEPCLYCVKGTPPWHGPTNEVTVWDVKQPTVNEFHPTQKPIELAERAIRNSSGRGALVCDWFLGSGTTLIAAHRTGRRCYGCEISPKYADVILRRAEAEGLTTELVPQG